MKIHFHYLLIYVFSLMRSDIIQKTGFCTGVVDWKYSRRSAVLNPLMRLQQLKNYPTLFINDWSVKSWRQDD